MTSTQTNPAETVEGLKAKLTRIVQGIRSAASSGRISEADAEKFIRDHEMEPRPAVGTVVIRIPAHLIGNEDLDTLLRRAGRTADQVINTSVTVSAQTQGLYAPYFRLEDEAKTVTFERS